MYLLHVVATCIYYMLLFWLEVAELAGAFAAKVVFECTHSTRVLAFRAQTGLKRPTSSRTDV